MSRLGNLWEILLVAMMLGRARRGLAPVPIHANDSAPGQRWQHGQDHEVPIAPRMPSRVMRGVDVLRRSKVIDDAEERAANRFSDDYLIGVEGARIPSEALRSGSADAHDVAIARAVAVGRHREISDVLGPKMTQWLVSFLVDDLSFCAMADRYWPGERGRQEMRGAMVTMLELLSHLYAALDRRRKRRQP